LGSEGIDSISSEHTFFSEFSFYALHLLNSMFKDKLVRLMIKWGTQSLKVMGRIPDEVIGFFR
jgi:hypothetical protein